VADRTVTITDDDVRFVEVALKHYRMFAEQAEEHRGDRDFERAAGLMRAQEFYAERFLIRIGGAL